MIRLFHKGSAAVTTAVDVMTDTVEEMTTMDLPLAYLPCAEPTSPASLTDDINLPLMVRELGARKKLKLSKRRDGLLKELERLDKELIQLDVLLTAANSL